MKKRFLFPLVAAIALSTVANAEVNNDYILKAEQSRKLFSEGKFSEMTKICEELIEISPEFDFGYACKGIALGFNSKNQKKREALGLPLDQPNLVVGSNAQICWKKAMMYFEIEARFVIMFYDFCSHWWWCG